MIRRIRRRLTVLRDEQSGLSMPELLVAAILTALLLAMVGTMFVQTTRLVADAAQTRNSNGTASSISNGITSVLRTATTVPKQGSTVPLPAIISGSRNSLTVLTYSDTSAVDPKPIKVTYSIAGGVITELRCQLTLSAAGFWQTGGCGSPISRVLGEGLQNAAGDTLFSYRNGGGDAIVIGNNPLTDAQRLLVSSINVTVKVQAPGVGENVGTLTDPVVITSTVVMRNLGLDTGQE
jgi:hypothetical protein